MVIKAETLVGMLLECGDVAAGSARTPKGAPCRTFTREQSWTCVARPKMRLWQGSIFRGVMHGASWRFASATMRCVRVAYTLQYVHVSYSAVYARQPQDLGVRKRL